MEMDERIFDTIDAINQRWVDKVTQRKDLEELTMSGNYHRRGSKAGNDRRGSTVIPAKDKDDEDDKFYEEMYELKTKLFEMEKSMNSVKERCGMSVSTSPSTGTAVDANLQSSDSLSSSRLTSTTATAITSSGTTVSSFEQRLKEKLDESPRDASRPEDVDEKPKTSPQEPAHPERGTDQKGPEVTESSQSTPPKQPGEGILRDAGDEQRKGSNGSQVSFVGDLDAN